MTASARSAKLLTEAATHAVATPVRAGTFSIDVGDDALTGWHWHELHQLEYALEGVAEVETETARYLLPPQQAIWIPAEVEHSSTLRRVRSVSVFFDPAMDLAAGDRVRVLAAAPVIREMIRYGLRWPISRTSSDEVADSFFVALANLVVDWLDHETPLRLPTAGDPLVAAAMAYSNDHLDQLSMRDVCAAVGASERSLRRAFFADTGMSWRRYVHESRLLRAMTLLPEDDRNILDVALSVGFQSAAAFTRAFSCYRGETPSAYRQRIRREEVVVLPVRRRPPRQHRRHGHPAAVAPAGRSDGRGVRQGVGVPVAECRLVGAGWGQSLAERAVMAGWGAAMMVGSRVGRVVLWVEEAGW